MGRDRERAVLDDLLGRIVDGEGGVALVAGEPGIGKTRLVEDVAETANGMGLRVVWGRCREGEGAPPYWPWIQVVRGLGGWDLFGSAIDTAIDTASGPADRYRLFDAVSRHLRAEAEAEPTLIVIDDLHRADDASLRLLRFVAAELWPSRIGLVVAYRDTELTPDSAAEGTVIALVETGRAATVLLTGLTLPAVRELLVAESDPVALDRSGEIHDRTGGNPFFVGELVRLIGTGASQLPPAVIDVVARRVDALPATTRASLEAAAVLGRDFGDSSLAAMLGTPAVSVVAALQSAAQARLIENASPPEGSYRFVHTLVQEALYLGLSADTRIELHGHALAVLREHGAPPGELAFHAMCARPSLDVTVVLDDVIEAATDADRRLAWEDAASWWLEARRLASDARSRPSRMGEILRSGARASLRAGRVVEAREIFEDLAVLARSGSMPRLLADAAIGVAETVTYSTHEPSLLALLDEASMSELPPADRIRLDAWRATANYWGPKGPLTTQAMSGRTVDEARRLDDDAALGAALVARQFTLGSPDHLAERISVGREALEVTARQHDEDLRFFAHQWLVSDLLQAGEVVEARAAVATAGRIADDRHDPMMRWWVLVLRSLLALFEGRLDEAEQFATEGRTLGERLDQRPAKLYWFGQHFAIRHRQGRLAETELDLRELIEAFPGMTTIECQLCLALVAARRDVEARSLLESIAANDFGQLNRDSLFLAGLVVLAEAAVALDDRHHATAIRERLEPFAERNVVQDVATPWGAAAWYLARLAALEGDERAARDYEQLASQLHGRWGCRLLDAPFAGWKDPLAGLSRREQEVLAELASGSSNKDIAAALYISVHTVERHVANVFKKLDVRSRSEATAWAHRHDLVR